MNRTILTGYFKSITAYTNGEMKLEDTARFTCNLDNSVCTQFFVDTDSWIEVKLDSILYDYVMDNGMINKRVEITGELRTKIGFGCGTITNFIDVKLIKVVD